MTLLKKNLSARAKIDAIHPLSSFRVQLYRCPGIAEEMKQHVPLMHVRESLRILWYCFSFD